MRPILAAIASFVASALLFLLASFTGSVVVRTTQPNGLAEIQVPYSGISFITILAAFWVLFFGVTLSLVVLRRRPANPTGRPFLGSGLVSGGVVAILFGAFWYLVNLQDEGPRCLDGCAPSLLQYYQSVYLASTVLAVLGFVAAGAGVWVLVGRRASLSIPL